MNTTPGERFEFVPLQELPGVTVCFIERSPRVVNMVHETYTSSIVREGIRAWECNGERLMTQPGIVIAWQPGDVHQCLEAKAISQRGMLVPPHLLEEIADEAGFKGPFDVKIRQLKDPNAYAVQDRFYRNLDGPSTRLERQTLFLEAIRKLLATSFALRASGSSGAPEPQEVERARRHIEKHFLRNIDLAELAEVAGVNRFRLLRAFKARFGCPPHAYLIDRKLARARQLLAKGLSPAEAAADVGFADQSHLTRHFKRFFGATPGTWSGKGSSAAVVARAGRAPASARPGRR